MHKALKKSESVYARYYLNDNFGDVRFVTNVTKSFLNFDDLMLFPLKLIL